MNLITGGAGFIGSHLVDRLLERGEEVVCLDITFKSSNIESHRAHPLYIGVEGDIRDGELLASLFRKYKFKKVFHLAAQVGVRSSVQSPALYEDVNIRGTQNLLEQCRQSGIEQFLFASSSSVYGNSARTSFRETDELGAPASPYAATKRAGEQLCARYHDLYAIPTTVLRLFSVYGPRQRPDMAIHTFVRSIRQNRAIPIYGDGMTARDYTYIDDIVQGLLAAADKPFACEVFNLGNASAIPLSELISELEALCGRKILIDWLPLQQGDVGRTCADIAKARTLLGYNPSTSLHDGLARFVQWFDREAG